MPIKFKRFINHGPRLAAWKAHYMAKGASETKAKQCADKKRRGATWPEGSQNG